MFKSIKRPIIIPQSEHLKLAGTLALLWGNARFERPPLSHDSVVAGIALHDRAYGYLDNIPVPSGDEEQWVAVTRRGFYMPCADPVADVITRHHLLRLAGWQDTPARRALAEEMRAEIQREIQEHGFDAELFTRIDCVTNLCDNIAFSFCRETPADGRVEVFSNYARGETTTVRYTVAGSGITLDPWPLTVEQYAGYVVGYRADGYPERLDGMVVPYHIQPGAS